MPSPILARADALMQRRHLSGHDQEEVPVLTDAIDLDDDIPLLVDIEPAHENIGPNDQPDTLLTAANGQISRQLINEITRRVEQRLLTEIPRIIAATVSELMAEQENVTDLPPD